MLRGARPPQWRGAHCLASCCRTYDRDQGHSRAIRCTEARAMPATLWTPARVLPVALRTRIPSAAARLPALWKPRVTSLPPGVLSLRLSF